MGFTSIASLVAVASAAAGAASTGLSIANAVKGSPKLPAPVQGTKDPSVDAFRRKNQGAMAPGAALSGNSSTLLGGSGPSQSVGTSTLLGQ